MLLRDYNYHVPLNLVKSMYCLHFCVCVCVCVCVSACVCVCFQQNVCNYNKNGKGATATGVVTISSGDESSLMSALATVGPVSLYVDASHTSFQVSS